MRASILLLLGLPVLLAQTQFDDDQYGGGDENEYNPYSITDPDHRSQILQQLALEEGQTESQFHLTEPTEPGPLDCREEQYPCTRLYSVHQPCKQCLNNICFYSLRRIYVINKEICVRTVCAHEELLRADLCRDQFSRCGVAALTGQCATLGSSCVKSCGGC
ncbi:microfibrillar-associated protein 2 [Hoplias malabaricus]|uniref:microfibrillar-associated protein 2 n=1 Tax=Hoplias malabaricus TaxID=27720 RepID=UPI00346204DF